MKTYALLLTLTLGFSCLVFPSPIVLGDVPPVNGQGGCDLATPRTRISPEEPTSLDTITLTLSMLVNTGGHSLEITAVRIEGYEIWADFVLHYPGPMAMVGQVITWIDGTWPLRWLDPGTYTVYVRPEGGHYTEVLTFTVSEGVPRTFIEGRLDGWGSQTSTGDCICQRWPAMFEGKPCPFCGQDPDDSGGTGSLLDDLRQRIGSFWQR